MKLIFYCLITVSFLMVSCAPKSESEKQETSLEVQKKSDEMIFNNADFYDENGVFIEAKAKKAIMSLAKHHGYPVFPGFEDNLWVSDYGTGEFTKLGLAAHMFINNETDQYMLMDLFLLPNQMLPEHWHLDGESNPAKMEGWVVRHGESYIVGEGENNLSSFPEIVIPDCHMDGKAMNNHVVLAGAGSFTPQDIVYSRHWQFAGSEGAIITEVANVHTDNAVRHSDKGINDNFLGI